MAVDSRSPRPPGQLHPRSSAHGNLVVAFRDERIGSRVVRRLIRSLDAAGVIGVFCVLMVLPSGVTRLAGPDTIDPAGLRGTVSVLQIRGPSDRRPHPVRVWRPPGPDSATIPVLYFLHGYPGSASDPFTAGLARTLNSRLQRGYPPFVFASVDGNGERHADTEWADAADGSDLVIDRVVDAAIPAVEGTHMRDAAHRAIAGFSMGGYGAMNIAMQNPGVFGQVVSIAGYFVVNDLSGMFGGRPAVVARNAPSAHPLLARGLRVLLDEDASDPGPLIRGQAAWMGGLLRRSGVPVTVHVQPGRHDWAYAMSALRYSFAFLADNWRQAAANESAGIPPPRYPEESSARAVRARDERDTTRL
jgi:enterochelin esterase-like enzyme